MRRRRSVRPQPPPTPEGKVWYSFTLGFNGRSICVTRLWSEQLVSAMSRQNMGEPLTDAEKKMLSAEFTKAAIEAGIIPKTITMMTVAV